jgi:hypothetical protein
MIHPALKRITENRHPQVHSPQPCCANPFRVRRMVFKRVMNTGVSITGALIALLLAIIGYLLVNPVGLQ